MNGVRKLGETVADLDRTGRQAPTRLFRRERKPGHRRAGLLLKARGVPDKPRARIVVFSPLLSEARRGRGDGDEFDGCVQDEAAGVVMTTGSDLGADGLGVAVVE